MAKLNGVDVSGWQPSNVLELIEYDFAIVKLTQGNMPSNKCAEGQMQSAKAKGLYGVYHYDNGNDNYKEEVDTFIETSMGWDVPGNGILFWDWEGVAITKGVARLSKIREYLKSTLGYAAIYASGSPAKQYAAEFDRWDYVWVAAYGSNPVLENYHPSPTQSYWQDAIIHQYCSQGRLGSYNGNLDLNAANIEANAWRSIAAKAAIGNIPGEKPEKSNEEIADEIIAGKWGNGDDRKTRLTQAGYNYSVIQAIVNRKLNTAPAEPPKKSNDEIAKEVLAGQWGNGNDRENALKRAGYDYAAVQDIVNKKLSSIKSNNEIADEVIAGKWGNGDDRKNQLKKAGYDYNTIQANVNRKLHVDTSVKTYTIKPGDTLSGIAAKYNTTWQVLQKLNNIKDPDVIWVGRAIKLP